MASLSHSCTTELQVLDGKCVDPESDFDAGSSTDDIEEENSLEQSFSDDGEIADRSESDDRIERK